MWALIFASLFWGMIIGVIYLAARFARFSFIRRLTGSRRFPGFLAGLVPACLIAAGTWALLGRINAAIIILHLMAAWLICDLVSRLVEWRRGKKFSRYYAGILALIFTAVYLSCGWYLANHVWRTEYELETDKTVGSLRIVQFADSHVGNTFDGEGFLELVREMQAENPDIVVITGDYVDDDTMREDMAAACRALGTLDTTYGVFYVFGNHDKGYYAPEHRGYDGNDLIAELEKNGVRVMQDEVVELGDGFYLIGRKDRSENWSGAPRASMEQLMDGLDPDRYSIVLDHQPSDFDAQEAAGADLVLCGHTHGGQLFPFHRMGQWLGVDDRSYGLEKRGSTSFIVTSGISNWAIQFKTGCKSEYVVIDVRSGGAGE